MSSDEIYKIYSVNYHAILEKLKRLHTDCSDSEIIGDIVDLLLSNKSLFEQILDDRTYCLNTIKQFTGEFEAIKEGDNNV